MLLLFAHILPAHASSNLQHIKICYEASHNPPYINSNIDSKTPSGILIDLIQQSAKALDWEITLYTNSWIRCQNDVKEGRAQAIFPMVSTPQRRQEYVFPPVKQAKNWYMWRGQYPVFTSAEKVFDKDNYQVKYGIGAPLGYVVWHKLKEKNWLSTHQYQPEEGFKMLALNKLDGYIVDRLVGLNIIKKYNLADTVHINQGPFLDALWYVTFNQEFYQYNQPQIHQFWQAMANMREDITSSVNDELASANQG